MPRYSIGAEFMLDVTDADEASRIVGNFIDSFPDQVRHECEEDTDPDVILQGPAEKCDS